ncbi:hypothetical protein M427DRAFT_70535 [Gonapodya prolifera JEL478]|uniref:Uncharacterized protein n=1 Tax=Gonapodya prolifera (strain JEL478) TaxID=1344416 RepID=A0A139ACP1_GONPJ|nr:hypothetical protein M427DRAFT_70535 [Gonapodya prolifera JEL478]|eukprot:KXS14518.1 hypothetical protein M427DRAFT_70535 [Gonapodya prolifera JEL478]
MKDAFSPSPSRVPRPIALVILALIPIILLGFSFSRTRDPGSEDRLMTVVPVPTVEAPPIRNKVTTETSLVAATIVTAYFPLQRSKHSTDDYAKWMKPLLGINAPLVAYTTPAGLTTMQSLRDPSLPTEYVLLDSPWDLPPIKPHRDAYEKLQHPIDPERGIHSPELYAVWNAKPYMVKEAIRRGTFPAHVYAWVDVGSFREHNLVGDLHDWPDPIRVREAFPHTNSSLLFEHIVHGGTPGLIHQARSFSSSSEPLLVGDIIAGTTFWGPPKAFEAYAADFYALHDRLLSQGGIFVGKDQTLINSLLARNPKTFRVLRCLDDMQDRGACGDPWFYFQKYFALDSELPQNYHCPRPPVRTFAEVLEMGRY